ncbi:MAG: cysteine hydrolase family protein [Promethearchaeota archaeon]
MSKYIENSESGNLYIIISNSMQNDFIEREYLTEIKNDISDPWKVSYEVCREQWIRYFRNKTIPPGEKDVDNFIEMIKNFDDPRANELKYSYHQFIKKYKHRVHINIDQSNRLWDNNRLVKFIDDLMNKAFDTNKADNKDRYYFIHLRDWHDPIDPSQVEEMTNFGYHCIKGSHGAKFIDSLAKYVETPPYNTFTQVINSNSLSSFTETKLDFILDSIINNHNSSTEKAIIGVFGVVTDVKLKLLTFELKVIHNFKNVYLCEDLSASFSQTGHKNGLNYMEYVLGVNVLKEDKFREIFKF